MNLNLKQNKLIIVGVAILVVALGFLYVSEPLAIIGENLNIQYEGTCVDGQIKVCKNDSMEIQWCITNYDDFGAMDNWSLGVEIRSPSGQVYNTTYNGLDPIPIDTEVVFSTVWQGLTFDTEGVWELFAVILEGTTLDDEDYVIDRIDNQEIFVEDCNPEPEDVDDNLVPDDEQGENDTTNDDNDNDGILNAVDNCPDKANPTQLDSDGDGIGNACDSTPYGSIDGEEMDIVKVITDNWLYIVIGIIALAVIVVVGKRFL